MVLKSTRDELNNKLRELNDGEDLIIAGDTDSVVYDSIIYVDGKACKIGDYFNSLPKNNDIITNSGTIVRPGLGKSPSVTNDLKLESNDIVYCMEHEVEKEMFEITVDGDSVIVTEDHSIMILRNDELIEVKPYEILDDDIAVKIDFYKYLETQQNVSPKYEKIENKIIDRRIT